MPDVADPFVPPTAPFLAATAFTMVEATGDVVRGHVAAGPDQHTPWGRVHGGLYATVVESACSVGASLAVGDRGQFAVGLSNHTDFLREHVEGRLDVHAFPIHQGRTGQLWQCDLAREDGELVAQGRVRLQNIPAPAGG